jgi:DNA-binding XRE family transcriptional regulator
MDVALNTPDATDKAPLSLPPSNDLCQALDLLTRIRDGQTVSEAAQALGVSRSTAFRRLSLIEEDAETGVVKLLMAKGLELTEDWLLASKVAALKGDHRPAKDALLHAKAIDPVNDGSQGRMQVAIMIGTPEQPIRLNPPQVLESE